MSGNLQGGKTDAACPPLKSLPELFPLGNPNGARALRGKQTGNAEAMEAIKAKAQERAENLRAIVADMKAQGVDSIRAIADELNARGILTPRRGGCRARQSR